MANFYLIHTDGTVTREQTSKTHLNLQDCYQALDCDLVEMVHITLDGKKYIMIVDEEGKLRDKEYNELASSLYNNPWDYIVGDAVLVKTDGWKVMEEEKSKAFEDSLMKVFGIAVK